MEREIKRLKRSRIPLVKVRWNSRRGLEFTWEREDLFKQKYPQLFTNRASSSTTRSIRHEVTMDDPNITIEEYIRLEEEKARRRAIVFNDTLTSEASLSCEATVSSLNDNEIDFRISFDESDDKDYTCIHVSIRRILGNGYGVLTSCTMLGPRERKINDVGRKSTKSGDTEVLES
ncbi:hypothetical protein Tco_0733125 [Tanacetum coccineum]